MEFKVVKFGGSSLADAGQIRKAEAIIRSDPARRYVVVSAPGKRNSGDVKITDMLYACYEAAKAGRPFDAELAAVRQRYEEIVRELGAPLDLGRDFEKIADHLKNGPQRDYMASRGEYLSAKLIAAYLGFEFVDSADFICFRSDGTFDWEISNRAVFAALRRVKYAVVPGFYGADEWGRIHTFSRGGSDITGSILARALQASIYENWTDVSGMLMADPRVVPSPETIPLITYKELRELSYMGASVMHEDAVFPVRKSGIPINIRNTNRPEDPGTMIVPTVPEEADTREITGIAGRSGFSTIAIEKAMMNSEIGFGRRVLSVLEKHNISFEYMPSGVDTLSVVVGTADLAPCRAAVMDEICHLVQPDMIYFEDNLSMIAVVGRGMVRTKGVAARVITAVAAAQVNIRMIDQGSSELNIIIGVDDCDREKAIRAIYDEFLK